jgi:hypothetical protein
MTSSHPTPTIPVDEITGRRTRRRDHMKPGDRLVPLPDAAASEASAAVFAHGRRVFENMPHGSRTRRMGRPWTRGEGATDRKGGA